MKILSARPVRLFWALLAFGLIAPAPAAAAEPVAVEAGTSAQPAAEVGQSPSTAAAPAATLAQAAKPWWDCVPSCPSGPAAGGIQQPGSVQEGTAAQPGGDAGLAPSNAETSPNDLFAQSGAGAVSGPESYAPFMTGDYLGGFVSVVSGSGRALVPLPGGAIPRFKMAENTSPLPVDRVFFNYDYYSDVPLNNPPVSLNAFTPGFEKTFFGGVISVEVRLPMASTLDNNVFLDGSTSTAQGEIGNLGVAVKGLVLQSETFAVSLGLAVNCPTARDTQVFQFQGAGSGLQMLNESVHLLPFVGGLWTPTDRIFCLGFMQFDIDANGDPVNGVTVGSNVNTHLSSVNLGRYNEQTMLYLEGTAGYWIYRDDSRRRTLNGIALFSELHVNESLNTSQLVSAGMQGNTISIVDLTLGADFQFGKLTTVTTAYCTPVSSQQEFGSQFRFEVNRRF